MSRFTDENGFELVDHDFQTGRSVWMAEADGKTVYRTDYPVQRIMDDNAAAQADLAGKPFGDWSLIASVPLNTYYDQVAEAHKEGDEKYVSRWLNDGDNAAFRVKGGRV